MRPIQTALALAAMSALALGACSKKSAPEEGPPPVAPPSERGVAATAPSPDPPAAPEAPAMLTPATLAQADGPIHAGALKDAVTAWGGLTVTAVGYPEIYSPREALGQRGYLVASPGGQPSLVECRFAEAVTEEVARDALVVVRGQYLDTFSDRVRLGDCALVGTLDALDESVSADPGRLDPERPIPATKLHEAITGWFGAEIRVVGNYHSTTTSDTAQGKTIRVDLTDPSHPPHAHRPAVGCELAPGVAEPAGLADAREGVVLRGTIDRFAFNLVVLRDCAFEAR